MTVVLYTAPPLLRWDRPRGGGSVPSAFASFEVRDEMFEFLLRVTSCEFFARGGGSGLDYRRPPPCFIYPPPPLPTRAPPRLTKHMPEMEKIVLVALRCALLCCDKGERARGERLSRRHSFFTKIYMRLRTRSLPGEMSRSIGRNVRAIHARGRPARERVGNPVQPSGGGYLDSIERT